MKLYINITDFMKNNWISYQDRIILQIIISCLKRGINIVTFVYQNSSCQIVNNQLFAEYFFTKTIITKNRYLTDNLFKLSEITNNDIYFEINILTTNTSNRKKYYDKIKQTGCKMYSLLPYGLKPFSMNGKKGIYKDQMYINLNYMDKIWLPDKDTQLQIEKLYPKCKAFFETIDYNSIADTNINDCLLELEKGLKKVIQTDSYIVYLPDYDNIVSNHICIEEIEKLYADKKIVIISMSCKETEIFHSYIYHHQSFGKKLILALDINYYTALNLYASAETVLISKHNNMCVFEIIHIKNAGGNYTFL